MAGGAASFPIALDLVEALVGAVKVMLLVCVSSSRRRPRWRAESAGSNPKACRASVDRRSSPEPTFCSTLVSPSQACDERYATRRVKRKSVGPSRD